MDYMFSSSFVAYSHPKLLSFWNVNPESRQSSPEGLPSSLPDWLCLFCAHSVGAGNKPSGNSFHTKPKPASVAGFHRLCWMSFSWWADSWLAEWWEVVYQHKSIVSDSANPLKRREADKCLKASWVLQVFVLVQKFSICLQVSFPHRCLQKSQEQTLQEQTMQGFPTQLI